MATKEDIARLEMATKEDFAKMVTKELFAKHETATKEHFAKIEKDFARFEKKLAVLNFAVFTMGPVLVAFMVKLTFFP